MVNGKWHVWHHSNWWLVYCTKLPCCCCPWWKISQSARIITSYHCSFNFAIKTTILKLTAIISRNSVPIISSYLILSFPLPNTSYCVCMTVSVCCVFLSFMQYIWMCVCACLYECYIPLQLISLLQCLWHSFKHPPCKLFNCLNYPAGS